MNPVNLFFACDNAYVPFLAVTLTSLKENCNPKRDYALRRWVFLELVARPAGWRFTEIITADSAEEVKRWRELVKE